MVDTLTELTPQDQIQALTAELLTLTTSNGCAGVKPTPADLGAHIGS